MDAKEFFNLPTEERKEFTVRIEDPIGPMDIECRLHFDVVVCEVCEGDVNVSITNDETGIYQCEDCVEAHATDGNWEFLIRE